MIAPVATTSTLCSQLAERVRSDLTFPRPGPAEQANALVRRARALRAAGDFAAAVDAFDGAIDLLDLDPVEDAARVRCEAALTYRDAGDLLGAEELLRVSDVARQRNPAACWFNLGLVLESQGRVGEAHHAFASAAEAHASEAATAALARTATGSWDPGDAPFVALGSRLHDSSDAYERELAEEHGGAPHYDRSFARPAGETGMEVRVFLHAGPTIAVSVTATTFAVGERLYTYRVPWTVQTDDFEHLRDKRVLRSFRVMGPDHSIVIIEMLLASTYTPNDQFSSRISQRLFVVQLEGDLPHLWSAEVGAYESSDALGDGQAVQYRRDEASCADWSWVGEQFRFEPFTIQGGDIRVFEHELEDCCPHTRTVSVAQADTVEESLTAGRFREVPLSLAAPEASRQPR